MEVHKGTSGSALISSDSFRKMSSSSPSRGIMLMTFCFSSSAFSLIPSPLLCNAKCKRGILGQGSALKCKAENVIPEAGYPCSHSGGSWMHPRLSIAPLPLGVAPEGMAHESHVTPTQNQVLWVAASPEIAHKFHHLCPQSTRDPRPRIARIGYQEPSCRGDPKKLRIGHKCQIPGIHEIKLRRISRSSSTLT